MAEKAKLLRAGFFRELEHDVPSDLDPSLNDAKQTWDAERKSAILRYLRDASVLAVAAGVSVDYFRKTERRIIGGLCLHTDARWLWPSDLAYYLEHSDVALPPALVTHMEENGWTPPPFTREELIQLSLYERD